MRQTRVNATAFTDNFNFDLSAFFSNFSYDNTTKAFLQVGCKFVSVRSLTPVQGWLDAAGIDTPLRQLPASVAAYTAPAFSPLGYAEVRLPSL